MNLVPWEFYKVLTLHFNNIQNACRRPAGISFNLFRFNFFFK